MARPIEHNPEDVIIKTMQLFWEQGYDNTSVQDIVKITGLKPGSLYNMYGNKDGIFKAVLETYSRINTKHVKSILLKDDNAIKNIELFLNEIVVSTISNENINGCLLVKTLLVLSPKDKSIQDSINKTFTEIEKMIEDVLKIAKENHTTTVDPYSFSKFIVSTIYGAHVYYKANKDKKMLQSSVDLILQMLKDKR